MPNRRLTPAELELANNILADVRAHIDAMAGEDFDLKFALRRKIFKELTYDERSKPMARRALKKRMRAQQGGICPICKEALPETYCVLDRFNAADGYVENNVQLIC